MPALTASWTKLATGDALQRSSHTVSTIGSNVYVFGGELKPRQPKDNDLHLIDLGEGGELVVIYHKSFAAREGLCIICLTVHGQSRWG